MRETGDPTATISRTARNLLAGQRLREILVLTCFLALCGFNLIHHAMWRDEMQPWLFARDSGSIPQLLGNLHYETHPRLWYLILWVIARFTINPAAMQAANFLIIGSAMALFVFFCPLPLLLRAMAVFGCFFVNEWGEISRNYALGVLFCFAFCALFPARRRGYFGLAAILFLATQSNHYAGIMAAALAGLAAFEACTNPDLRARIRTHRLDAAASVLLVLCGLFMAARVGIAQPDASGANYSFEFNSGAKLATAFEAICDGFLPQLWNWTSDYLPAIPGLHAILGMAVLLLAVGYFWRKGTVFWTHLAGGVALAFVIFSQHQVMPRHSGHLYLWFLVCAWMACYFPKQGSSPAGGKQSMRQAFLIYPLLTLHVLASAYITNRDYHKPYSLSKTAALYIKQHHLDTLPIAAYPDHSIMPLSGYLDKPLYYLNEGRWGTFIVENNRRPTDWDVPRLYEALKAFAAQGHPEFLVVLSAPIKVLANGYTFVAGRYGDVSLVTSLGPSVSGEDYWIFYYKAGSGPPM